ncbi:MAG: succinylglutamate desuccinylase/aspartoacylase family protein [Myxococcota bacterium]
MPENADDWLDALPGPVLLDIEGKRAGPPRALSVLLHGNEPSGFRALHRYLREGRVPERRTLAFVGAVDAARTDGRWAHRLLPGRRDLNRCFLDARTRDDGDAAIARAYLGALAEAQPEALVDVHNNTGHNPPYGVLVDQRPGCLALVELFTPRGVVNALRLGTLVEAWRAHAPSVVVECGQAGRAGADEVGYQGIRRYLEVETLPPGPRHALRLYRNTVRFTLRDGIAPAFATAPASATLTLRDDLERFNFRPVPAGTVLGWWRGRGLPLEAFGPRGEDHATELVGLRASDASRPAELVARRAFTPIMMTTRPDIVVADCLCYLVRDLDADAADPLERG